MKTIVITTGGTVEKIDGVRGITNFSSGTLGVAIAEKFASNPNNKVILLHGKKTPLIQNKKITSIQISDTESLLNNIQLILKEHDVNVFIHAMAVSDYTVDSSTDVDSIIQELEKIPNFTIDDVKNILTQPKEKIGKMSSSIKQPILLLKQTPKVIQQIKKNSPSTTLVGFKLLNKVSETELIDVAIKSMEKSNSDYVVANDLQFINGEKHKAIIIDKNGKKIYTNTKTEIAETLFSLLGK